MHGNVRTLSILSALRSRSEKDSELSQQKEESFPVWLVNFG